jgi:hypothetical protein
MNSSIILFLARVGVVFSALASILLAQALLTGSGSFFWCLVLLFAAAFASFHLYRFSIAPFITAASQPRPAHSVRAAAPPQDSGTHTEYAA